MSPERAARIRSMIAGKLPDQLRLPVCLRTRAAVASLIAREYGIAMSLVTVRRYPLGLGLEPTDAGAARLREQGGHRVLAEAGIPGDRPAGQGKHTAIYWSDERGCAVTT